MNFKYVELFAGIGGFRAALDKLGGECVLAAEWDKFARQSYTALYGDDHLHGDVTKIDENEVPDHDVMVFGMPCQAFSVAGKRLGFDDMRGTLYFEAMRIARVKKPKVLWMENVKGLVGHDKGRTLEVMAQAMCDLGYTIDFDVLNSKYFGVPQNRERIFMVGVRDDLIESAPWVTGRRTDVVAKGKKRISALVGVKTFNFDWPTQEAVTARLRDILEPVVDEKYYLSEEKTAALVAKLHENYPIGKDGELSGLCTEENISPNVDANYAKGMAPSDIPLNRHRRAYVAGVNSYGDFKPRKDDISTCLDAKYACFPDNHGQRTGILEPKIEEIASPEDLSYCIDANYTKGIAPNGIGKGRRTHVGEEWLYASEKERNTVEVLRKLREEAGSEEVAEWRFRIFDSLREAEVLQQNMYGSGIQRAGNIGESKLVHGAQESERRQECESMREVRVGDECGCTSQRRELEEQFARELAIIMQELSREGASSEKEMQDLRKTAQGSRLLQQALHQIQEIWGSELPKVQYRIRKLSPLECWRLQGFSDEAHETAKAAGISDSQRYKQAGNAVTVNVIEAIGRKLIPLIDEKGGV